MTDKQNPIEVSARFVVVTIDLIVGIPIGFILLYEFLPNPWPPIVAIGLIFGAALFYISRNKGELDSLTNALRHHQKEQEKKPYVGILYWIYDRIYLILPILFGFRVLNSEYILHHTG